MVMQALSKRIWLANAYAALRRERTDGRATQRPNPDQKQRSKRRRVHTARILRRGLQTENYSLTRQYFQAWDIPATPLSLPLFREAISKPFTGSQTGDTAITISEDYFPICLIAGCAYSLLLSSWSYRNFPRLLIKVECSLQNQGSSHSLLLRVTLFVSRNWTPRIPWLLNKRSGC